MPEAPGAEISEWDGVYLDERPPQFSSAEEYFEDLRSTILRKMKWQYLLSYSQTSSVISDMNHLAAELDRYGLLRNEGLFPEKLANDRHAVKHFAMEKGHLNEGFLGKRMKLLRCGLWVLDLEQMLRDLLKMESIKQVWRDAPVVQPDDPEPDELEHIFQGDMYRKHPLVLQWSGQQRARRQEWSTERLAAEGKRARELARRRQDEAEFEDAEELEVDGRADVFWDADDGGEGPNFFDFDDGGDSPRGSKVLISEKDQQLQAKVAEGWELEELWVFFRQSNDSATLNNPLAVGATYSLQ